MNLSQLYYFKKLAELEHYTRTAKELYISQPALSDAISSLEKELDVPLFQKEGRNIKLTAFGEEFYRFVQASISKLDEGVAAVQRMKNELGGFINLGTTFTVQDDYLPGLLSAYQEAYGSAVHINTYQGFTNYLTQSLHNETLDIVFCGCRDNETEIEYFPLTYRELVLGVRDDHPLANRTSVSLDEITDFRLLTYRPGTPIGESMQKLVNSFEMAEISLIYDDDITMASVISFDGGVGALMLKSIGLKLFSNLKTIPITGIREDFYWVYLAYKKKRTLPQSAQSFIEFIKRYEGNDASIAEDVERVQGCDG